MTTQRDPKQNKVLALKVHQWLNEWNDIKFRAKNYTRRPGPFFYLFALPAADLKALSGIHRRATERRAAGGEDLGIQRRHEKERSDEIHRYVRYGYPMSVVGGRTKGDIENLQKPGWLPTSIVVNILKPNEKRGDQVVAADDIVRITEDGDRTAVITLPKNYSGASWEPVARHPIEVIDGQHRLWAFEEPVSDGDFELPVIAFHGLDISWQAYLFWTINIKPKRINASLAFDLYPLLRTEEWLERFDGLLVYRETRAQELVELLWSHPKSPWHNRINMLGEPGLGAAMVTQAAWVRSLLATYVKAWEGQRVQIGGLFGGKVGERDSRHFPGVVLSRLHS